MKIPVKQGDTKKRQSHCIPRPESGQREGGRIHFHRVRQDADPDSRCRGGGFYAALTAHAATRQETACAARVFHHIPSRVVNGLLGSPSSLMAGLGIASHLPPSSSL